MADIVNLRSERKRRKRAEKAKAAEENRAKFGVSSLRRRTEAAKRARDDRNMDGKKLDD